MPAMAASRSVLLGVLLCVLVLAPGCGDQQTPADERLVAVYGAAIRWLIDDAGIERPEPLEGIIYVKPLGDGISLEVQVGVVDALGERATIRFIDDMEEAVDIGRPGDPVRGGGLLLGMDDIAPAERDQVGLYVERYRDIQRTVAYELVLTSADDRWRVVGNPEQVPSRRKLEGTDGRPR